MKLGVRVLSVVVVVAAAYGGASWYVGRQAEGVIRHAVEQANQQIDQTMAGSGAAGARLLISEYRRHVFSSDVVYTLQLPDGQGHVQEFLLGDHLSHGPLPWQAVRDGRYAPLLAYSRAKLLPSAATQAWFDALNGQEPLNATTEVGWSGNGVSHWRFQPLNLARDGSLLKFSGGVVQTRFDQGLKSGKIEAHFDTLDYTDGANKERLVLQKVSLSSDTDSTEGSTVVRSTAGAGSFVFSVDEQQAFALQDARVTVDSTQRGALAEGTVRYQLGKVGLAAHDLGSMDITLSGHDLDVQAMSALAVAYDRMARSAETGSAPDPDAEPALRKALWDALASNPVVALEQFLWRNEQGESVLRLAADLGRPPSELQAAPLLFALPQALKAVRFEAGLDRAMFVQAYASLQEDGSPEENRAAGARLFEAYAERLSGAGLAAYQDGRLSSAIRYSQGKADVNGRPMAVGELMQRALAAFM